jgi:polysaccharide pyruvyl transferase WcaK-like protein
LFSKDFFCGDAQNHESLYHREYCVIIGSLFLDKIFNVGISGSYRGMNSGDEAILQSIITQLRASIPVKITVFTQMRYQFIAVSPINLLKNNNEHSSKLKRLMKSHAKQKERFLVERLSQSSVKQIR